MNQILLVEDDASLGESLQQALRMHGWQVVWFQHADAVEAWLKIHTVDVIVLDWNLPMRSGLSLLSMIRSQKYKTPVLMLTARDAVNDKVKALEHGADDYLVKPFALIELNARLHALLRRSVGAPNALLEWQHICVDIAKHQVFVMGQLIECSKLEFELLRLLIQRPKYPVSKEKIIDVLYQDKPDVSFNAIEALISQLRKKIGADAIKTLRGIGYVLN